MTAVNLNRAVRGPVTAVPVVAGKGVRIVPDVENNRFVVEADETVLFSQNTTTPTSSNIITSINLSEAANNFERIRIYWLWNPGTSSIPDSTEISMLGTRSTFTLYNVHYFGGTNYQTIGGFTFNNSFDNITYDYGKQGDQVIKYICVMKIIGINRISST